MLTKVRNYIEKYEMIQQNDRVVLGISGGADSICLLFVLLELRQMYNLEIVGVHVNHNLRGEEALRDQRYVEEICRRYDVPLEVISVDVSKKARLEKLSFEEAGRNVRREAFKAEAQKVKARKIATAHHQNDNAETFLMNLARGTGISGLKAIAPINGYWIRPLLCVSRKEVEAYLQEHGIEYCTDSTNTDNEYTRNLVRNQVIPLMENGMNKNAVSHVNDVIEELGKIEQYLQSQLDQMWNVCVKENLVIDINLLSTYPELLQEKLCKRMIETAAGKSRDISRIHVAQLLSLKDKQVGRKINLPYGLVGKRVYEGLAIERVENDEKCIAECIELVIPGETLLADGGSVNVTLETVSAECNYKKSIEKMNENSYTKYFDYDIIKDGLVVRSRRMGDEIVINENGNRQTVKKFFTNQKIPQEERDNIQLLVEGDKVLWIIGLRKSEAYNITKKTKQILKVQFIGGNHGRNN